MQIGQEIPMLPGGIVPVVQFNKLAAIVNRLRKINLGPGMTGGSSSAGVYLDAAPSPSVASIFPYGDKWVFGLEVLSDLTVRIHNPLMHRSGLTAGNWFDAGGTFGDIPDKTFLEAAAPRSLWTIHEGQARIFVAYRYDTATATDSIIVSSSKADVSTLPTDDGAGTVDPLRYYLIPLYILQGTATDATVVNTSIYIDLIHGLVTPNLI